MPPPRAWAARCRSTTTRGGTTLCRCSPWSFCHDDLRVQNSLALTGWSEDEYRRYQETVSDSSDALYQNPGDAQFSMLQFGDATSDYSEALRLRPERKELRLKRAKAEWLDGRNGSMAMRPSVMGCKWPFKETAIFALMTQKITTKVPKRLPRSLNCAIPMHFGRLSLASVHLQILMKRLSLCFLQMCVLALISASYAQARPIVLGTIPPSNAGKANSAYRCVNVAALHHKVNPNFLQAILRIESKGSADRTSKNQNGSMDIGIAGINSVHFSELLKHGITEEMLMDDCVSTYVAAWQLHKKVAKYGDTWAGAAAYHSGTPYFNARYQILLFNEMVRMGVQKGPLKNVPPVNPSPLLLASYNEIAQKAH